MKQRVLSPLTDLVFKRIFGQEKMILIELINAIIQPAEPVIDIEYLAPDLLPDGKDGKVSIVDVRCLDSKRRHFILEIQVVRQQSFQERVLYYASKTYGKQLPKGKKYEELQPVFLLSIMDHSFDTSSDAWLHRYCVINEVDLNKKMEGIHLIFLELEKCRKLGNFTMDKEQDRWISFLTQPEKFIAMPTEYLHNYPNLLKAVELLDESNYTPGQLLAYEKYMDGIMSWNSTMVESFDNGFEEGMEKGMEKGIEKGTDLTIAIINDIRNGQKTVEEIAQAFDVSIDVVKRINSLI
jgi:predicted transposase/invertase (TIGR01784 family)